MIAITGATGHLGRLVIDALLDQNVPASEIVAIARDAGKAADLAARGVQGWDNESCVEQPFDQ